ncbi:uncharacterized protein A4U43_C08F33550 [Asparagus officinalis]|nr:uncharacterized protein A4U43_C08F33550 [Asparagus officinalis]
MGGGRRPSDLSGHSVLSSCSSSSSDSDVSLRSRNRTYLSLLRSYQNPPERTQTLQEYKDAILRHKPGDWIEAVRRLRVEDHHFPTVTTLLLVGPKGSGKSSLINRISRVFEEDKFAPVRAQVFNNSSVNNGSCFLQGYMIPRSSKSLCLYDSRGLSISKSDNLAILKHWMTEGVSHGEMVIRNSDTTVMKEKIKTLERQYTLFPCRRRSVNFVIYVVDGVSVLKSMKEEESEYREMIIESFNCPYLSFKDDKPAVVVTHGDELSFHERAQVRTYLGDILGIPPSEQIFDIPDSSDYNTELATVDMLRYSIEHADRNLRCNPPSMAKVGSISVRVESGQVNSSDLIFPTVPRSSSGPSLESRN